jgi:phospholipid/cholesterol/gamma-HCH transport system substrate-binding protein
MEPRPGDRHLHPAWWALILVSVIVASVLGSGAAYRGTFRSFVPVTVTADRSGLVMETGGKVMLHGVQVGRIEEVSGGQDHINLHLQLFPDQLKYIPANVGAQIRATTVFGAKYVELIYPANPSPKRLAAGAMLRSSNVSTEVNTVFQNLVGLLDQIDPAKLNAVLSALSEGFRGQGERIGHAITDANQVLLALNARSDVMDRDWRSLKGLGDAYGAAAGDIVSVLAAASTTSATVTGHASALDALLLSTIGAAQAGISLIAPNEQHLIDGINTLEPTTGLLAKYDPEYTCLLQGATWWLNNAGYRNLGGNGRTDIVDATIHFGRDKYNWPDNLPIVAAKGGPDGKPGCGSLPDASKMFPVRELVTNTGWGTGMDIRPNPGVAPQMCYADFLPVTRAVPEPPTFRNCLPGPAVGPVPYPGAPPYGAHLYGPGGVPLWPGIPPAGIPPPVPVEGTPVAPGKIPPLPAPPAVFGAAPPPVQTALSAPEAALAPLDTGGTTPTSAAKP